jgi:hypothetical protein
MMRAITAVAGLGAALALAACGSSTSGSTTGAKSTPTPQPGGAGRFGRNGAAGELVKIAGTSLVLNTTTGDVTVDYESSTPVTKTHTGTLADVTAGLCITATGSKDASGTLTASAAVLSTKVNGSCQGPFGFGGGGERTPGVTPRPTPPPGAAPRTPPVRGEVTGVSGTSVSVLTAGGTSTTITVPTTARISVTGSAAVSDLAVGDCVLATGSKSSSGVVTARSLSIVPAGPSGCFTGGFGGFRGGAGGGGGGGFGGGGFGGGGGEGGAGA